LAEQVKNNGYGKNHDKIMNLAQAMLAGRNLEAFLNEKRSQEAKKQSPQDQDLDGAYPRAVL
jgi:hypothetical protein